MENNSKMEVVPQGQEPHKSDQSDQAETQNEVGDAVPQPQQQQAQQDQTSYWGVCKSLITRALIIYFITSMFRRPQQTAQNAGDVQTRPSSNLFNNGTLMDLYVYISESEYEVDFTNSKMLLWHQPELTYGNWNGGDNDDGIYTLTAEFSPSKSVKQNGSIWMHVYFVKSGNTPNPKERYSKIYTVHKVKRLNRYKKKRYLNTHNLLTGETSQIGNRSESAPREEILSHWHPNMTINIVDDHTPWVQGHVPAPLDEYVQFEHTTGKYFPIVYLNDYWNLMRDYQPINDTTESLELSLTFQPLSLFKWQLYTAQSMRSRWTSVLGQDLMEESDEEQDSMKEAFLETSPILLGLTVIISIVHSVFEFLAFKNDIQFWNNRQSLEGLSVRSVFFNVFQSVVVLLYVLDNDTNMVIRISVFVGLFIEIWKIHKVVNIELVPGEKFLGVLPKIKFSDKGSYVESSTRQYDILAFRYLSMLLFPLLAGYAVYSVVYLEHKGWYSWVLGMLYGFLLTFGFIMMTPQLFINYKLKSVAHLPWRMLTYKFLNTFIDDIFAFVIKMPTMYRLGCFRDDIVFCIYLYQRWIYRVDPKRVNEYGVSGEMLEEHEQKTLEAKKDE